MLGIFRAIDQFSNGKLNGDNVRVFLRNFDCNRQVSDDDIKMWIRRYDTNVDAALDFPDVVTAFTQLGNYKRKKANANKQSTSSTASRSSEPTIISNQSNLSGQPISKDSIKSLPQSIV